jgi:hypothetical protein
MYQWAITYLQGTQQRIYAFVRGQNGHLYVNYWDGAQWQWADQGAPPGTTGVFYPAVITYLEASKQRIYAFVVGHLAGGGGYHLYVNYWDGAQWQWADQGAPPGTYVLAGPGVITYLEGGKQRIYAFVLGGDHHLHVNYWDGAQWQWADQGLPEGNDIGGDLGVITYLEAGKRRIYAFVDGTNGHLYVNYWDGGQWQWADQGVPPGTHVGHPGVITYLEAGKRRIYAFVDGDNDHLYVNYTVGFISLGGEQWQWADQGVPPGSSVEGNEAPGVITYVEGSKGRATKQQRRIYAFVRGYAKGEITGDEPTNYYLYVNYWDGAQWQWADQGAPPGTYVLAGPGVITYLEAGKQRIYAFVRGQNGHLYVNYWDGAQWRWADQGLPPVTP